MKQYYIVSIKHTSIADSALTLWKTDGRGYCWNKFDAGVYINIEGFKDDVLNVPVEVELANQFLRQTFYDGRQLSVLPNTEKVRQALGIDRPKLYQPKKNRTCYLSY